MRHTISLYVRFGVGGGGQFLRGCLGLFRVTGEAVTIDQGVEVNFSQ